MNQEQCNFDFSATDALLIADGRGIGLTYALVLRNKEAGKELVKHL